MKDFSGLIGFALMIVLVFKGCGNDVEKPLIGCNGTFYNDYKMCDDKERE